MIKTRDILQLVGQGWKVGCVGAIGVGTHRVGWRCEQMIGYECAIGLCPVHASLDVVDLREGNLKMVDGITADVARGWLFPKQIAATGDAMGEGNGGNGHRAVFVNDLWGLCVYLMQDNGIRGVGTKVVYLWLKEFFEILWCINMEGVKPSKKP